MNVVRMKKVTTENDKRTYFTRSRSRLLTDLNDNPTNVANNLKGKDADKNVQKSQLHIKIVENSPPVMNEVEENIDISMLSIKDDNDMPVDLPTWLDIGLEVGSADYVKRSLDRRTYNREMLYSKLHLFEDELMAASFDMETGERYLLENLDYRHEMDISRFPLGKEFLSNTNVSKKCRRSVIDWMFQMARKFRLPRSTVNTAVAISDRYLKMKGKQFPTNSYILMLISCWRLSSKADISGSYPLLEDIVNYFNNVTKKSILEIEENVLVTLDFYTEVPSPVEFLRPLTIIRHNNSIHQLAKLFIDIALHDADLTVYPSIIIAAAAFCLASKLHRTFKDFTTTWCPAMQFLTGLGDADITPVVDMLYTVIKNTDFGELRELHLYYGQLIPYLLKRIKENAI